MQPYPEWVDQEVEQPRGSKYHISPFVSSDNGIMKWNTFHGFTLQIEELLNYGFCEQRKFPNSLTRRAFVWYNTNLRPNLSKLGQKWKKNSRHFALHKIGCINGGFSSIKNKELDKLQMVKKRVSSRRFGFLIEEEIPRSVFPRFYQVYNKDQSLKTRILVSLSTFFRFFFFFLKVNNFHSS